MVKEPYTFLPMKKCVKCRTVKEPTDFYADRTSGKLDGLRNSCKDCDKAAVVAYRKTPKGKAVHVASSTRWNKRNPERCRAYDNNRTNKDERLAYNRQYAKDHPIESRMKVERRRARKANAPVNDFTLGEWKILQDEFGGLCAYCGNEFQSLSQDHVVPLVTGGSHTYDNIVPACITCNLRKGVKSVDSFLSL